MVKKIPAKLYKFQTYDKWSIKNLISCHIWFSKPEKLNDPFDCAIPIIFTESDKDLTKLVKDHYIKWLRELGKSEEIAARELQYLPNGKPSLEMKNRTKNMLREHNQQTIVEFSKMGVACFTTVFHNILMWSHYADGHKGFCLEFDTNYRPFHDRQKLHEVIYSKSYPTHSPLDIVQSPNLVIRPLITKSKNWKYENEWRFIKDQGNSAFEYDPKALTAIYFGCSMPDDQKSEIATLLAKFDTPLFNMKRSETQFSLEYEPYNK